MFEQEVALTSDELRPIRDLIAQESGVYIEDNKYYFLEKRVARRMKAINSLTAKEYYRLISLGHDRDELNQLIMAITTNETYFFRNLPQLESFADEALGLIVAEKEKVGDRRLRLWSAACSSGEEAYTLAIYLKEKIPNLNQWKIEIIGTDIDEDILDKGKLGIYESRAVKDVTPALLKKYFTEVNGRYQISKEIKAMVSFAKLNLLDRRAMRLHQDFDFVFCRNVLIYFQDENKKKVVNSLYDSLRPGGFIFLGHAESVGKLSAAFQLVKLEKALAYRK